MSQRTALITNVDQYMGAAIADKFSSIGIKVVTGTSPLLTDDAVRSLLEGAGQIDILVANLAQPPMSSPVEGIAEADWQQLFSTLVHPLMYLVRAVAPQMKARGEGKIIAVTSAAPLKGIPNNAAYCAARGAQNGFIRAVGMELARDNIQVNAIAQNYINNDTYYPDDLLTDAKFIQHLKKNVPTNRVGDASETAELAAYLASEKSRHMVAQIIPLAGGWV